MRSTNYVGFARSAFTTRFCRLILCVGISRRKKAARQAHEISKTARKLRGIKAKIFNRKRFVEKAEMKKTIRQQQQKDAKASPSDETPRGAVPSFLLDRQNVLRTKVLSNLIKQKRKEKAGKWQLPIPKVKALNEEEMFRVLKTGKRKSGFRFMGQFGRD